MQPEGESADTDTQEAFVLASPLTRLGGVARYWERLTPGLEERKILLEFVTGLDDLDRADYPTLHARPSSLRWYRQTLIPLISASNPSWVISSIPQSDILYAFAARRSVAKPWTIFLHGQPYPLRGQASWAKRTIWKWLWRWSAKRADLVIAVSEAIAELAPPGPRVIVIPPPMPDLPKRDHASARPRSVGFVGRMSYEKDPALFAEIAEKAARPAIAYGAGELLPRMRSQYRSIDWRGESHDLAEVFSQFSTLLVTSRSEGLSLVMLEAATMGVPSLAVGIGGIPSVVHPQNRELMLVPPAQRANVGEWAWRLNALDDEATRKRVTGLQLEWVRHVFDARTVSDRIAAALREIS